MIHCQNCGQTNAPTSNFCRSCGLRITAPQVQQFGNNYENNYENSPPRPYVWKTDEYQTQNEPRKSKPINQVQPLMGQFPAPTQQALAYQRPGQITQGYRCPRCSSQYMPRIERRISTAGWIVFAILLVTFFPLFWIGFLMKEEVRTCPVCNLRIG